MIDHLIDRSDPGSWARFFAQRDGTRFIADPSGKQLEAQTPDEGTDVSGIGAEDFISHHGKDL
jgi:hypothetical protein